MSDRRFITPTRAARLRFASDGTDGVFSGYAAVFGELIPDYNERVMPGAFDRSLAEHKAAGTMPSLCWQHRWDQPIGVWQLVAPDDYGLAVDGRLATSTVMGREAHELLKFGAVNGLSLGFRVRGSRVGADGTRELTDIEILEISVVSIPAAPSARIDDVRHAPAAATAAFLDAARRLTLSLKGT